MIIWLDAQLSPQLARWIAETFGNECVHVRDLGLRDAEDSEIFQKARDAGSVVMTKDEGFVRLVESGSPPPQGALDQRPAARPRDRRSLIQACSAP